MFKKLCILLIFSKLKVTKLLIDQYRMHNLYAIFAKLLNICKQIAGNLVNESGNVPRRGVVPKFSDLEVVALNMASEAVGIDSESLLFAKLQEYRAEMPNLISRRQYNDVKVDYSNCTVIGDRGYISAQVQLDLFETANIRLEVPYRCNQKEWKPTFPAFAKARKRIETLFSQLCEQFMIIRNYAKDTDGLFARIIGKISALTILQYINYKNEKPIGRVKYALF